MHKYHVNATRALIIRSINWNCRRGVITARFSSLLLLLPFAQRVNSGARTSISLHTPYGQHYSDIYYCGDPSQGLSPNTQLRNASHSASCIVPMTSEGIWLQVGRKGEVADPEYIIGHHGIVLWKLVPSLMAACTMYMTHKHKGREYIKSKDIGKKALEEHHWQDKNISSASS